VATYITYTPTTDIAKAMFNFDASGGTNYKLSGTVRVSVSDAFSFIDWAFDPNYSSFFPQLYTSASNEVVWTAQMLTNIQDVLDTYSQFANIIFTLEFSRELANTPIDSEAKERLKALSKDEYEEFAEKLKAKDADYFLLKEIFPITQAELNMGLKLDVAAMVENIIDSEGVIPATYMSKICKYHFTYKNYRQNLERLKLKGVACDNKWIGGVNMKVYYCK